MADQEYPLLEPNSNIPDPYTSEIVTLPPYVIPPNMNFEEPRISEAAVFDSVIVPSSMTVGVDKVLFKVPVVFRDDVLGTNASFSNLTVGNLHYANLPWKYTECLSNEMHEAPILQEPAQFDSLIVPGAVFGIDKIHITQPVLFENDVHFCATETAITFDSLSSVNGIATFSSNVTIMKNLTVIDTTSTSNLYSSNAVIYNGLIVQGKLVAGEIATDSLSSTGGVASFNSNVSIRNNLSVGGQIIVQGKLVAGEISTDSLSSTGGVASFNSNVSIRNNLTVGGEFQGTTIIMDSNALFKQDLRVQGKLTAGEIATDSMSSTGGVATFSSNVAIQNDLNVGGTITASNMARFPRLDVDEALVENIYGQRASFSNIYAHCLEVGGSEHVNKDLLVGGSFITETSMNILRQFTDRHIGFGFRINDDSNLELYKYDDSTNVTKKVALFGQGEVYGSNNTLAFPVFNRDGCSSPMSTSSSIQSIWDIIDDSLVSMSNVSIGQTQPIEGKILTVKGDAHMDGDLEVTKDITVDGDFILRGVLLKPNSPVVDAFYHDFMGLNLNMAGVIKFNQVNLNVGGAYDPSTGMFTTPVTGHYQVSLSAVATVSDYVNYDNICIVALYVNGVLFHGSSLRTDVPVESGTYEQAFGGNTIMHLQPNDTISWKLEKGSVYNGTEESYNHMSICFLG